MVKRVGQEDGHWPMWEHVAVSAEVAAALAREKQEAQDARQRARAREKAAHAEVAASEAAGPPDDPVAAWDGPRLKLFSRDELARDAALTDTRHQDPEARQRKSALHALLTERGEYRRLAPLPADWRAQLDAIEARFPNFGSVLDYLRALFVVAELSAGSPHLDPLLLNGPPGVGKSLFAEQLGAFFGSGYRRISLETAQTNAQLAGSDEFWSNSKTGMVFDTLVEGDYANPLFLLDELDKVRGRSEFDPLGPLYSLLEPATARAFRDLSMPRLALDASRIIWLLTANDVALVPAPILSRVRRFDIPPPTPAQAVVILHNIFEEAQRALALPQAMAPLSADVVETLSRVAPRRQRQMLREAIGRALYAGRRGITGDDLRRPVEADAIERRMGF